MREDSEYDYLPQSPGVAACYEIEAGTNSAVYDDAGAYDGAIISEEIVQTIHS